MTVHPDERAPVSRGWVSRFGLLYLGQNAAWAGPTQLLIAIQVADWYPGEKEERLAWVMAAGGAVMLVATPLAGAVSDRTGSRFGRRAPWILVGALVAAIALVWMGFAPGYAVLLAGWLLFQAAIAFSINAAQAVAPDQVPRRQYGLVSGVMGLTYTLGVVVGTLIGTMLGVRTAYLVTALVLVLLVGQFLVRFRDPQVLREKVAVDPVGGARWARFSVVPSPRRYPDFAWVFLTRLLVTLGNSIALFYLLYFLRDRIRVADAEGGVLVLTAVYAVMVIVSAIVSGRWSDRVDRRLPFVSLSSLGVTLACLIMAWALDWWVVVVAAAVLGVSWGVYMAVDQALINEVLPTMADRGRDVGIMNVAVALPNTFSPVIAALALRNLGGYPGLYLLAGALALLGGVLVWRVRDVR
ncbi:MFS transporter [Ornithinimicrobium panacihumi]|uniref:MFS transporter n=1 Tax=Ornithinimicrobium panacihumi TaxID=2008449 RepID=UPI003F8B74A3